MKYLKVNLSLSLLFISGLSLVSCNEGPKKDAIVTTVEETVAVKQQDNPASQIISKYLVLKDALVGDNANASAQAGEKLLATLEEFKVDQFKGEKQSKLTQILSSSKASASQIVKSDIATQREQFLILSQNMIDLVGITGAAQKLYQQHCPMYNNNKGGSWLSAQKEVKNPYFGSSMLNCGVVQREI